MENYRIIEKVKCEKIERKTATCLLEITILRFPIDIIFHVILIVLNIVI